MTEERRSASMPKLLDSDPLSVLPAPDHEIRRDVDSDPSGESLQEVQRAPAVAVIPIRIITINPPPPSADELPHSDSWDDAASTPNRLPKDLDTTKSLDGASGLKLDDDEDLKFEDLTPTPALARAVPSRDADGERRSDPGDAPEIGPEDVVTVEAAAPAVSRKPPPARKPGVVPPRPPLVIVPPHMGSVMPASAEATSVRRKSRLWWEDFFNDDYLRAVEKLTDKQIAGEVDFIEQSLGIERGGALLDLGCGTGRHAIEFASRNYAVVGFELSLAMLARASDEAQERDVKLNFVQGDMREMTFDEQFDGVFCWNTSFGYFDEEKNLLVVDRVHRALKPGGRFLLDVVNRDFIMRQSPSLAWFEGDGCVCMDEMAIDFITSRMRIKRTMMLDDGRTRETEYSLRVFSLHELGKILHEHGFKVTEVSGRTATPGVFLGSESPRAIILAEKR